MNKKKIQIIIEISENSPAFKADIEKLISCSIQEKEEDLKKLGIGVKALNGESCWELFSFGKNDFIKIKIDKISLESEELTILN